MAKCPVGFSIRMLPFTVPHDNYHPSPRHSMQQTRSLHVRHLSFDNHRPLWELLSALAFPIYRWEKFDFHRFTACEQQGLVSSRGGNRSCSSSTRVMAHPLALGLKALLSMAEPSLQPCCPVLTELSAGAHPSRNLSIWEAEAGWSWTQGYLMSSNPVGDTWDPSSETNKQQ